MQNKRLYSLTTFQVQQSRNHYCTSTNTHHTTYTTAQVNVWKPIHSLSARLLYPPNNITRKPNPTGRVQTERVHDRAPLLLAFSHKPYIFERHGSSVESAAAFSLALMQSSSCSPRRLMPRALHAWGRTAFHFKLNQINHAFSQPSWIHQRCPFSRMEPIPIGKTQQRNTMQRKQGFPWHIIPLTDPLQNLPVSTASRGQQYTYQWAEYFRSLTENHRTGLPGDSATSL